MHRNVQGMYMACAYVIHVYACMRLCIDDERRTSPSNRQLWLARLPASKWMCICVCCQFFFPSIAMHSFCMPVCMSIDHTCSRVSYIGLWRSARIAHRVSILHFNLQVEEKNNDTVGAIFSKMHYIMWKLSSCDEDWWERWLFQFIKWSQNWNNVLWLIFR